MGKPVFQQPARAIFDPKNYNRPKQRPLPCKTTGAFWLLLTLCFEFGFGHFVQGRPWPVLLEAYTFQNGNLWPLVLLVTLFGPLIALRIRGGARS